MVKDLKKPRQKQNNTINSVLAENKPAPKSRQQINQENYQKNKAKLKTRQKERYQQQKKQAQLTTQQYYQANSIRILMSLKEYTELNKEKMRLWTNFNWTLQGTSQDIHDIITVMKLRESADELINDYWETAKKEIKKGKSWNSLTEEQRVKLIKYWGWEKARRENNFLTTAERLEREGQAWEKEIELAKFHEGRGKVKCECYQCQESKKLQGEIKAEIAKESEAEKVQCPECSKMVKKLDEESGVCKSCTKKYE